MTDNDILITDKQEQNDFPLFRCFRCGICCSRWRIRITLAEASTIAQKLGLYWQQFHDEYLDNYYVATDRFLLRQINDKCIFLTSVDEKQVVCRIHSFKPISCTDWTSSLYKPECKEGLRQMWQLIVNEKGEIQGTPDKIFSFSSFMESLS